LGGADSDGGGEGIAVDGTGRTYLTGSTQSADFPTTPGAFDTSYKGGISDVFVTKLNASGSALAYSTFVGGADYDEGWGIAVRDGRAYVTGFTQSADFPTTPGAFDRIYNGGSSDDGDVFVTKPSTG
jgi:hypothetical protein